MSIIEGNKGKSTIVFAVTLSKVSTKKITVNYATQNVTATVVSDYVANAGTLTFQAGSTKQNISISIVGDKIVESNETFKVNLSNALNAGIIKANGTGTILNDDGAALMSSALLQTNIKISER